MLKLRIKEIQSGNALMRIINTAGQVVHMESIAVADYELKKTISFHPLNSSSGSILYHCFRLATKCITVK